MGSSDIEARAYNCLVWLSMRYWSVSIIIIIVLTRLRRCFVCLFVCLFFVTNTNLFHSYGGVELILLTIGFFLDVQWFSNLSLDPAHCGLLPSERECGRIHDHRALKQVVTTALTLRQIVYPASLSH